MEIQKFAEPALIQVTEEMTWEQRDAAHDANIKALSDLSSQAILLIASELYQNKFTGAYLDGSCPIGSAPVGEGYCMFKY